MYIQSFFVTSVRGIGLVPTTSDSAALGVIGFMNAAFGFRADFFAVFLAISTPSMTPGGFAPPDPRAHSRGTHLIPAPLVWLTRCARSPSSGASENARSVAQ